MRLVGWTWLCLCLAACGRGAEQPRPSAEHESGQLLEEAEGPRHQPKPGERVRQPELDAFCAEQSRPEAFYYHGGRPVDRLAYRDGCTALFLSECDAPGACATPREQEPGMWCCGESAQTQAQASR